jgi:hypothetical protein
MVPGVSNEESMRHRRNEFAPRRGEFKKTMFVSKPGMSFAVGGPTGEWATFGQTIHQQFSFPFAPLYGLVCPR